MAKGFINLTAAEDCHGQPEILNTDQGSQFTITTFADIPQETEVRISEWQAAVGGETC